MQTKSLEGALTLTIALTWVSSTASKTGKIFARNVASKLVPQHCSVVVSNFPFYLFAKRSLDLDETGRFVFDGFEIPNTVFESEKKKGVGNLIFLTH